mmetsp:Transcript_22380/g.66066  ORF Transcript_22380/g.66066 Transcript_22380/m.66066 type:complete len:384 (+) Transcript_22380:151-1302(+)
MSLKMSLVGASSPPSEATPTNGRGSRSATVCFTSRSVHGGKTAGASSGNTASAVRSHPRRSSSAILRSTASAATAASPLSTLASTARSATARSAVATRKPRDVPPRVWNSITCSARQPQHHSSRGPAVACSPRAAALSCSLESATVTCATSDGQGCGCSRVHALKRGSLMRRCAGVVRSRSASTCARSSLAALAAVPLMSSSRVGRAASPSPRTSGRRPPCICHRSAPASSFQRSASMRMYSSQSVSVQPSVSRVPSSSPSSSLTIALSSPLRSAIASSSASLSMPSSWYSSRVCRSTGRPKHTRASAVYGCWSSRRADSRTGAANGLASEGAMSARASGVDSAPDSGWRMGTVRRRPCRVCSTSRTPPHAHSSVSTFIASDR